MAEADRILRIRTVLLRTGLSRSTLYRKIREGSFPSPLRISVHGAGWLQSAVDRWMADPIAFWEPPRDRSGQPQSPSQPA
ncbi:helix-turn-helix transcriptional regulator [Phenylobacterium montanum]|uniref:AlpA family phage regulatory protein n=1 Tax=Phenylobacterium montanum TaxID=2823693 RepID=A0A975G339_9CAUL|nr:AlpA family phage regulatory protein [Caulobacter sp. S6]QUD89622.1 AlpA family phage regulatory protein [Caulobacter sp. S6]